MQNLSGTEWEGMTEEEVFLSNRKLVRNTIRNQFSNHIAFCKTHMIEQDDLIQIGNIGLLNAIRDFDPNGDSSFRSYAINCISWAISTMAKKESLRNRNTQTFELANIVSAETKVSEEEDITLLDTLESDDNTSELAEDSVFMRSVIEFLKADEDINEELLYILIKRAEGQTFQEIAKYFGVHPNTIGVKLKRKKAIRVKNRLMEYLKNGE